MRSKCLTVSFVCACPSLTRITKFLSSIKKLVMMVDVVRDIMTKEVITIDENKTALEAARLMSEKGISSLIVIKDGMPKGILTERDFIKKVCAKELHISQAKIGNIMSKNSNVCRSRYSYRVAVQRMVNQKIRRLPIMQEGRVVGIITVTDLARHLRTILLLEGALSGSV